MQRLTAELASTEGELRAASANLADLEGQLRRALTVAGHCAEAYQEAKPAVRRQLNQASLRSSTLLRRAVLRTLTCTNRSRRC